MGLLWAVLALLAGVALLPLYFSAADGVMGFATRVIGFFVYLIPVAVVLIGAFLWMRSTGNGIGASIALAGVLAAVLALITALVRWLWRRNQPDWMRDYHRQRDQDHRDYWKS